MQLLTPLVPAADAYLPRRNPLAKLAAALLFLVVLFASRDGVTAAILLVVLLGALPFSGLAPLVLLRRSWLVGVAVLSIVLFNTLFAAEQAGAIVVDLGPLRIGAGTLAEGMELGLRLLAIVLAGILATATSDPTDVADALVQQLRVSPRFAAGVLAALRLLPVFAQEWQILGMARRARGIDAGRSPVAAVRITIGRLVGLLVGAIRRATRLAAAMEARGLGARPCRSVARMQRMRAADWVLVGASVVIGAAAVGVSVALGTWRPLFG